MPQEEKDQIEPQHATWLWSDCKLVLCRTNPKNPSEESYQNLQAEAELQSDEIEEPFIPYFSFSQQFHFNNKKGFYCIKGTPLPTLKVKLQKNYLELLQEDEDILMIYCELTVAYPRRKDTHFYLEQIRTLGQKKKFFLPDGTVQFKDIVIKETSMQKANSKFSFLVSICASSVQQNKIILKTLISTAFYSEMPRIIRKSSNKSNHVTHMVSPCKFRKPVCQQKSTMQKISKQSILQTLKYLNENESKFSLHHPLYIIYHFSHILQAFYKSDQIDSLTDVLELIYPLRDIENGKNTFISYQLKKTKKIKKTKSSIPLLKNKRKKLTINAKLTKCRDLHTKPLLVTLNSEIFQLINDESSEQTEQSIMRTFRQQIESQVSQLNRKFSRSTYFYIEVDLLRQDCLENCWRIIEKETIYEVYRNHYNTVCKKLKHNVDNGIE